MSNNEEGILIQTKVVWPQGASDQKTLICVIDVRNWEDLVESLPLSWLRKLPCWTLNETGRGDSVLPGDFRADLYFLDSSNWDQTQGRPQNALDESHVAWESRRLWNKWVGRTSGPPCRNPDLNPIKPLKLMNGWHHDLVCIWRNSVSYSNVRAEKLRFTSIDRPRL